jgi:hypothetical protein
MIAAATTEEAPPFSSQPSQNMKALFPNGIALVVGVADYQLVSSLPEAVLNDAKDVSELLEKPEYCGYSRSRIACLLNSDATAVRIRDRFKWLATEASENDTVIFFFSGHGTLSKDGDTYLLPSNFDPSDIEATGISATEIKTTLSKLKAKRVAIILDCCHAGGVKGVGRNLPDGFTTGIGVKALQDLSKGEGWTVLSSCQQSEVSLVLSGYRNSVFTHALLDGLKGKACTAGENVIRVLDLFNYVADAVPEMAPSQHPRLSADLMNNFALAMAPSENKGSSGNVSSRPLSKPLEVLHRKLEHLETELAIASDPEIKFSLNEKLNQIRAEIARLSGQQS